MAINNRIYFPVIITFLTILIILSLFSWSWSPDVDDVIVLEDSLTDPLAPAMEDSQSDFLLIETVGVNDQGTFITPDEMTL